MLACVLYNSVCERADVYAYQLALVQRPRVSEGATSEEKREARAARNRIAAQESRDRRKREFTELYQRVAQLEAENAALRESNPSYGNEKTERLERENAELLER
jgi:hypothetical protein